MQIKADQLAAHLERRGLASIYCISGSEPLQLLESVDLIRQSARLNGFTERSVLNVDRNFDWYQLKAINSELSLFSNRRLIELRLGSHKPGKNGGTALIEFAETTDPETILVLTADKLDKKTQQTRWYKALANTGDVIQVWPVEPAQLPGWVIKRAQQYGKRIDRDAAGFIAEKVEGNLLAAKQELEKLRLLVDKPVIELTDVIEAVSDNTRFDVFALIELSIKGNTGRAIHMLRGMKNEGIDPLSIFGILMWELRRVCSIAHKIDSGVPKSKVFSEFRVWQQRQTAINSILQRLNKDQLASLLRLGHTLDKILKGAIKSNPWEFLESFMFRIAGIKLQSFPDEAI